MPDEDDDQLTVEAVSFRCPTEMKEALEAMARADDRTLSSFIRISLQKILDQKEKEAL